ncbi:lipoprotein, partial [bacterium AH-315-A03]|nr:lipoprotein [bacterium AH-315-A03]
MRKYTVALTFLLVVSGCGGSSDTATPATTVNPAATQALTTTAVPTTTVAAT